jgi:hypothetical protein
MKCLLIPLSVRVSFSKYIFLGFHRYWPDGTFQFDRRQISVGFVKTLRRHTAVNRDEPQQPDPLVVVTTSSLQFCDLDPRTPPFLRSSWNPAVNLVFLDGHNNGHDDNDEDKSHHDQQQQQQQILPQPPATAATMLVAQHCRDFLRPPPADRWPNVTEHAALPVGRSVYFDAHGVRLAQTNAFALPNNNNDNDNNNDNNGQVSVATYMVTKMRVLPLECPTTPPDDTMAIIRRELNLPIVNDPRADETSSTTTTATAAEM